MITHLVMNSKRDQTMRRNVIFCDLEELASSFWVKIVWVYSFSDFWVCFCNQNWSLWCFLSSWLCSMQTGCFPLIFYQHRTECKTNEKTAVQSEQSGDCTRTRRPSSWLISVYISVFFCGFKIPNVWKFVVLSAREKCFFTNLWICFHKLLNLIWELVLDEGNFRSQSSKHQNFPPAAGQIRKKQDWSIVWL